MEQELNAFKNDDFETKDYFQLEFQGQKVKKTLEFKKWYEGAKKYIIKENDRRKTSYIQDKLSYPYILTIEYCNKCLSYTICSSKGDFSYIKCNRCNEEFCIGCSRKKI